MNGAIRPIRHLIPHSSINLYTELKGLVKWNILCFISYIVLYWSKHICWIIYYKLLQSITYDCYITKSAYIRAQTLVPLGQYPNRFEGAFRRWLWKCKPYELHSRYHDGNIIMHSHLWQQVIKTLPHVWRRCFLSLSVAYARRLGFSTIP